MTTNRECKCEHRIYLGARFNMTMTDMIREFGRGSSNFLQVEILCTITLSLLVLLTNRDIRILHFYRDTGFSLKGSR